jgi:hypothetical protein
MATAIHTRGSTVASAISMSVGRRSRNGSHSQPATSWTTPISSSTGWSSTVAGHPGRSLSNWSTPGSDHRSLTPHSTSWPCCAVPALSTNSPSGLWRSRAVIRPSPSHSRYNSSSQASTNRFSTLRYSRHPQWTTPSSSLGPMSNVMRHAQFGAPTVGA